MAEVIAIWDEADRMVDELILAADQLHERASSLNATEQSLRPILHQILDIDARLTPLEGRFTKRLGGAGRTAQLLLLIANLAVATTLIPIGIFLSHRLIRRREEAEAAPKLSEERFNLAVTGSTNGPSDWSPQTRQCHHAPAFQR